MLHEATGAACLTLACCLSQPQVSAPSTSKWPVVRVMLAQAATLQKADVIDTTGAGDSFIGSVLYGLCTGMSRDKMLQLASVVAACKCTALGARAGLPYRSQLAADLFL